MAQSVFEKEYIISPDYCDAAAAMSPLAAFTIFQAMAAEHAEQSWSAFRTMLPKR